MLSFRSLVIASALLFVSCTGSVTFRSPASYTLDIGAYSSQYTSVTGLVTGNMVASIPCTPGPGPGGDQLCQAAVPTSGAGSDIVMHCSASGACDPDPVPYVEDLGVQDFSQLASGRVSVLDHLELVRIELTVDQNTSNVAIPAIEVRWGSESSSASQLDTTTQRLATLPMIPVGQTGDVAVTLDDAGMAALTDYLHGTSQRARFFLRSNVDLSPGQQLPSGTLAVTVGFIVRASGQLR